MKIKVLKKVNLDTISLQSFVTSTVLLNKKTVKGGEGEVETIATCNNTVMETEESDCGCTITTTNVSRNGMPVN